MGRELYTRGVCDERGGASAHTINTPILRINHMPNRKTIAKPFNGIGSLIAIPHACSCMTFSQKSSESCECAKDNAHNRR